MEKRTYPIVDYVLAFVFAVLGVTTSWYSGLHRYTEAVYPLGLLMLLALVLLYRAVRAKSTGHIVVWVVVLLLAGWVMASFLSQSV